MHESSYTIKTEVFEGPLDTLLSLIEKRKLFISDISLAEVADDYIAHVKSLENFPIADSAHFILIASTLVLIKSKSLLPSLQLSEEEEASIDDLEHRLKEYQKYKSLSQALGARFGTQVMYTRTTNTDTLVVFAPDKKTTVERLFETIRAVISSIPKVESMPKAIVEKVISLEEMIDNLSHRISESVKMSFRDFAAVGKTEKVNVIVSFLAMLELVKQGIISVRQDADFTDIEMETNVVGVPHY